MKVTRLRVLSEAWPGKSSYRSDIGAPPSVTATFIVNINREDRSLIISKFIFMERVADSLFMRLSIRYR